MLADGFKTLQSLILACGLLLSSSVTAYAAPVSFDLSIGSGSFSAQTVTTFRNYPGSVADKVFLSDADLGDKLGHRNDRIVSKTVDIPSPAGIWLLGSAIGSLVCLRRRKNLEKYEPIH